MIALTTFRLIIGLCLLTAVCGQISGLMAVHSYLNQSGHPFRVTRPIVIELFVEMVTSAILIYQGMVNLMPIFINKFY